jgi:hypothetical protein
MQISGGNVYLKRVADVEDERVRLRLHGDPFPVLAHLQSTHFALAQDRQQVGVCVSSQPQSERREWAWWVVVHARNTVASRAVEGLGESVVRKS